MHRPISTRTSTRVIWASGTERGQPTPLRQPMALLEDMPDEPTVALPVPRNRPAVISSTPLALVRPRTTFLVKHMPVRAPARGNGMPVPARISGATCALLTPTLCVATDTRPRARNERRSPLTLSPAPMRGFFFAHGVPVASEAQAIFCRRRHQPRRPAPAPSRLNY